MSENGKAILETGSEDQRLNDISLSTSGTVFSLHRHSQTENTNLWENWTPNLKTFDARVIHPTVTGSILGQHGIQKHEELVNEQKELKAAIRQKEKNVANLETIVHAINRDNNKKDIKDKNGNPASSKTSPHCFIGCDDKEAEEINNIKSELMNNPYEKALQLNISYKPPTRQSKKFSIQESVDPGPFFMTGDDYFSDGNISVTKFGGQNENPPETVMQPVGCRNNFPNPSVTHTAYVEPHAKFEETVNFGPPIGGVSGWSTGSSNFDDDCSKRIKCSSGQSENLDLFLQDLGISDLESAPPPDKKRKVDP